MGTYLNLSTCFSLRVDIKGFESKQRKRNFTDRKLEMLPPWFIIFGALLSFVTVAGNGVLVYLIISKRRLHGPANWIVLSLALADLFVGACSIVIQYPLSVALLTVNEHYSIISLLYASSTTNLCLLAVDRYLFITKPLRYDMFVTTKRAFMAIVAVWIVVFLPHLLMYVICVKQPQAEDSKCVGDFAIFDFVVFETLPMLLLAFAVGNILYINRKRKREIASQRAQLYFNRHIGGGAREASTGRNERTAAVKIIGVAVAFFTTCYLAELTYTVLYQFSGETPSLEFEYGCNLLYLLNSATNPVAYAFFKGDIKKELKRMLCCEGRDPAQPVGAPEIVHSPNHHSAGVGRNQAPPTRRAQRFREPLQ